MDLKRTMAVISGRTAAEVFCQKSINRVKSPETGVRNRRNCQEKQTI
jgi:hypothetical protein